MMAPREYQTPCPSVRERPILKVDTAMKRMMYTTRRNNFRDTIFFLRRKYMREKVMAIIDAMYAKRKACSAGTLRR